MTITFTNAVVEDDGYGVEVNGRSLEAIISTALGTRLGDKGGYSSGLPKFRANSCDVTVTITPHMVDEGRGLYIWGKSTGNGKTSWACKIMSYFFRKIAFNTGLENEGLYIFLPTFLEDLRDNYDNKDPEFDEILRMIKTCRLLIIDDIGAERVTDWVRERMVSIINTRVSNNLTLFSS